ncbi:uncharacterized protein PgNI_04007, partial [Pyricularia grisea]|uniref:Uncharacterized protein n=1 Tax=Pyricularia grisea TaxID=148305 RepID=A0A6P8BC05_PYRGI
CGKLLLPGPPLSGIRSAIGRGEKKKGQKKVVLLSPSFCVAWPRGRRVIFGLCTLITFDEKSYIWHEMVWCLMGFAICARATSAHVAILSLRLLVRCFTCLVLLCRSAMQAIMAVPICRE